MMPTWCALNGGRPLTRITPNRATGPGFTGSNQRREVRLVIDLDLLLAELRLGEALLAERGRQRPSGGDHVLRDDRVAGLDGEGVAELRRIRPGGVEPRQLDRSEAVLDSGIDRQDDPQRIAAPLGPRVDRCVIIALAAQQFGEKVGVGARAAADLRRIGGILALGFERRLLAKGKQVVRIAHRREALDLHRVAKVPTRLRRLLRRAFFPTGAPLSVSEGLIALSSGHSTPRSGIGASGALGSSSGSVDGGGCGCAERSEQARSSDKARQPAAHSSRTAPIVDPRPVIRASLTRGS